MKQLSLSQNNSLAIAVFIALATLISSIGSYFPLIMRRPPEQIIELTKEQAPELAAKYYGSPAEYAFKRKNYAYPISLGIACIILLCALFMIHNNAITGGIILALCWLIGVAWFVFYPLIPGLPPLLGKLLTGFLMLVLPALILLNSRYQEYRQVFITTIISIISQYVLFTIAGLIVWFVYSNYKDIYQANTMSIEELHSMVSSHASYAIGAIIFIALLVAVSTFFIRRATIATALTYAASYLIAVSLMFWYILVYGFEKPFASNINPWIALLFALSALVLGLFVILARNAWLERRRS